MILRKTQSLIVDDLKLDPEAEKQQGAEPDDDGDICTPKSEPPTDDDKPPIKSARRRVCGELAQLDDVRSVTRNIARVYAESKSNPTA